MRVSVGSARLRRLLVFSACGVALQSVVDCLQADPQRCSGAFDSAFGICQWFHFSDHRLSDAVDWLQRLGKPRLRTGISWADWHRPGALQWFDYQMDRLREFDTTITLCFTPPSVGQRPCHTSPPRILQGYADFAEEVIRRYVLPRPGNGKDISRRENQATA